VSWRERAALTIAEAAELLSVSESTMRRSYRDRFVTIGGRARVPVRLVLEIMGEAEPEPAEKRNVISRDAEREVDRVLAGLSE
jgi:hypothetical protein